MTRPVGSLFRGSLNPLGAGSEFGSVVSTEQRRRLLRGIFDSYYAEQSEKEVIFDTNRMWCAHLPALMDQFPETKVIACVRNVAWVMDSIERRYRANPYEITRLFNDDTERNTVYSRVDTLAQRNRLVGYPWAALKEAFYGEHAQSLLIVEYDFLAQVPHKVIPLIYQFLQEDLLARLQQCELMRARSIRPAQGKTQGRAAKPHHYLAARSVRVLVVLERQRPKPLQRHFCPAQFAQTPSRRNQGKAMTLDPFSGQIADQNLNIPPVSKVLFVDSRVPDLHSIIAAAEPGVKIVALDANQDGVQQMASALNGLHNLESIGVVSHGDEGVLLLGNGPLFAGNIAAHQADLSAIGAALGPDGDILLYGCDVGRGDAGSQFLAALTTATGADVAASSDSTGDTARDGDWNLEITTGQIDGAPMLDGQALAGYHFLLHTASVSTVAQLKAAIATGNTDGSADTITLTGNITFAAVGDAISINVTDGQTMSIVGGGFTLSGANLTRVLNEPMAQVRRRHNLTIQRI
jgi:hypothetical protein